MALVLSRQVTEEILIGEDILIRVVEIRGHKVRILVEAPQHIRVMRMEILNREEPTE